MKHKTLLLYALAWGTYIIFSMMAFPFLRITVMLFSIPLTMLGGWLYRYKGALITTALTIPYHHLLLNAHSTAQSPVSEVLNPFGIGSQLIFSLCAAILISFKQRYHKLNNDLEQIVAERTNDLHQLADHLIKMEDIDRSIITSGLLDDPFKQLELMQETSKLLYDHLNDQGHPETKNAQVIRRYIEQCRNQLTELINEAGTGIKPTETLQKGIKELSDEMVRLARGKLKISLAGAWEMNDRMTALQVYNIVSEAVANAVRHAHAKEITLECQPGHVKSTIIVENDGDPFPSKPREGMGLPLMRYRARSIGGSLTIQGGKNQRTRVICTIPHGGTTTDKAFPQAVQRLNTST